MGVNSMPKKEKLPKQKKPPKQAKHVKQQKKRKGRSVQDFIGVKTFTKYGLMTQKGELLFYLVSPTNISVLSYVNIEIKIRHLMMVLSSIPDIEITCTDSSECFDDNKAYAELQEADKASASGGQDQAEAQRHEPQKTPPQGDSSKDKSKSGGGLKPERRDRSIREAVSEVKSDGQA